MSCDKEMQEEFEKKYLVPNLNEAQNKFLERKLKGDSFKSISDQLAGKLVVFGTAGEVSGDEYFLKMFAENAERPYKIFIPDESEKWKGVDNGTTSSLRNLWALEDRMMAQGMKDYIASQNKEGGLLPDITQVLPGPDGIGKVVVYGTIDKGHKRKGKRRKK